MSNSLQIHWKRISIEAVAIVASILLAFGIDAWWDELQNRENAQIILASLHEELVQVDGYISYQSEYVKAISNSARRLLESAIGEGEKLDEREIDRLLADQTWFVSSSLYDVPELESLISNDELSLINNSDLRRRLGSWFAQNQSTKRTVELQEEFVNESFLPYLEENAFFQQIYNVSGQTPGHPADFAPIERIDVRELRAHSELLDDPIFQNLLTRRISRMYYLVNVQDSEYVAELRELISLIEQELAE